MLHPSVTDYGRCVDNPPWPRTSLPQRPKSPASPNLPFPANSPVLKDLRSAAQSSQRPPGNFSCHSWHFCVQYSRTHIVHMWDSHMMVLKRACPAQSSVVAVVAVVRNRLRPPTTESAGSAETTRRT